MSCLGFWSRVCGVADAEPPQGISNADLLAAIQQLMAAKQLVPVPQPTAHYLNARRYEAPVRLHWWRWPDRQIMLGLCLFEGNAMGPPNVAHGGATSAALDDAVGGLGLSYGYSTVVGKLNVTFRQPSPLKQVLLIQAVFDHRAGRKFSVHADLVAVPAGTPLRDYLGALLAQPLPASPATVLVRGQTVTQWAMPLAMPDAPVIAQADAVLVEVDMAKHVEKWVPPAERDKVEYPFGWAPAREQASG